MAHLPLQEDPKIEWGGRGGKPRVSGSNDICLSSIYVFVLRNCKKKTGPDRLFERKDNLLLLEQEEGVIFKWNF